MMDRRIVETTEQARQGETSGHVRWVLVGTIGLTIAAVGAIWLFMVAVG